MRAVWAAAHFVGRGGIECNERSQGSVWRHVVAARRYLAIVCLSGVALAGCDDRNKYQPPPPPEVGVAKPEQRRVTCTWS